jgi:hypothetical protein
MAKYKPAIDDGTITAIVPFVMTPFGALAKEARAFIKRALGDPNPIKQAKARLQLSVATARGTARLALAWSVCAALIVGGY